MIQFNVMFRTGDKRKRREKSVGIGKSSHSHSWLFSLILGLLRKYRIPNFFGELHRIAALILKWIDSTYMNMDNLPAMASWTC